WQGSQTYSGLPAPALAPSLRLRRWSAQECLAAIPAAAPAAPAESWSARVQPAVVQDGSVIPEARGHALRVLRLTPEALHSAPGVLLTAAGSLLAGSGARHAAGPNAGRPRWSPRTLLKTPAPPCSRDGKIQVLSRPGQRRPP